MTIVAGGLVPQEHAIQIAVLGAFQARVEGQWHQAPTRQVARVATILAGWPGEPIERDRIVAGIWGEKTPTTVTNTLQVHVSHLRRLIGKHTVRSRGTSYLLDVAPEAVDAEQLIEAVHEAARMRRREHYARGAELLAQATGLWRGTPFPDITDPDLEARRARLTELRDQAREDLVECRLELARDEYALAEVVAEAKELVARQPLREKGHVLLVRALAAADRQGEASQAFEEASARLRETMGLDPGRALVEVHTAALNHDDALLPRAMRRISVLPDAHTRNPAGVERVERPDRRQQGGVERAERPDRRQPGGVEPSERPDGSGSGAEQAAARVRTAVVDLGARLVTVTADPDADDDPDALALAVASALEPDMPGGVRILPKASTERLDGVADIVTSAPTGPQAALATRGLVAPLVVIAAAPIGVVNEVVVSTTSPSATRETTTRETTTPEHDSPEHDNPEGATTAAPQRRGA